MPYDKSLDAEIFKDIKEFEDTRISVGVFSYNGGEKKIQISRENKSPTEEWRFAKLGRMTKVELEGILPLINTAVGSM
ncbi:MAG: hypothetical protein P9M07_02300 [Candidatus Aceula meridiana]|nr:hypothetical protein [Candidatus Aceula meridiana]